jgi:hypothetical protein
MRTLDSAKHQNKQIMNTFLILAQTDLATGLGKIVGILQAFSMVIMVGAMLIAGVSVVSGRLEFVKFSLIGGAMAALAWVLVKTLFSSVAGTVIEITPQSF